MKAVVLTRTGGPEVLQVLERPAPVVAAGEVRIVVHAAGLNFADTMARVGLYPAAPKPPCVLGYEVAGEVESIGEDVSGSRSPRLGELNLPSVDDFDRQDLVATPSRRIEASSRCRFDPAHDQSRHTCGPRGVIEALRRSPSSSKAVFQQEVAQSTVASTGARGGAVTARKPSRTARQHG
jgi:Alcohol dehydrogenase GroES-like domain